MMIESCSRTLAVASALMFFYGCERPEHIIGAHHQPGGFGLHDWNPMGGASNGAGGTTDDPPAEPSDCSVRETNPGDAVPVFYAQAADADGIGIFSSGAVEPEALQQACRLTQALLQGQNEISRAMIANQARIAVIGRDESLNEVPGFESLGEDADYRSHGPTSGSTWIGVSEENLLCLADDPYLGESLFVHVMAHGIRILGIQAVDPEFSGRLASTFEAALAAGKWSDTYAATSPEQYHAEGVQSWFDANLQRDPANGIHNYVNTRAELEAYDPGLAALIALHFPTEMLPLCP